MGEWSDCNLGDVVTFQRGFDITKKEQVDGPYPVVSSSGTNSFHNEFMVKAPGIVIGRKGTLGTVFYLKQDFWPHDTTLWVKDFHGNHPEFLYYYLREFDLEQHDVGSSNPTLNRNHVHLLPAVLPPLAEQKAIAAVLSSLDDKIDLLHRQNKTLEALAETLFRQWFVEEAQEDWAEGCLGDVAENPRDSVKPGELDPDTPYIGLEHVERKCIALYQSGSFSEVESNKYSFVENDILFGKLRPYFHKVCFAPYRGVCSTDILVIRPKKDFYFAFCMFAFFQADVVEYANIGSGGTRMPRTNWEDLSGYPTRLPDDDTLREFSLLMVPLINKIKHNLSARGSLEKLRDTLLPKLMSGEVRVAL